MSPGPREAEVRVSVVLRLDDAESTLASVALATADWRDRLADALRAAADVIAAGGP